MSLRFLCGLFILVVAVFCVIAQNGVNEKCGIKVSDKQIPWLVGIQANLVFNFKLKYFVTGALISRRHVIAPIRDLYFLIRGNVLAVYLGFNITENCIRKCQSEFCPIDDGVKVLIEGVLLQRNYTANEVSLIKLREAVPYTDNMRPICLPSADFMQSDTSDKEQLFFAGLSFKTHRKYDLILSTLNKPECEGILSNETQSDMKCKRLHPLYGGIVVKKTGDRYELIGLLQRNKCNTKNTFSNVFLHLNWVRRNVPELSIEDRSTSTNLAPPTNSLIPLDECGKRKVEHIELIVNGEATKAGDWPWHVAIYKLDRSDVTYICGGSLISKATVLTAAHCATENGVPVIPDILNVILGKYNLNGGDLASQERQVHSVIVHEGFTQKSYLENDIALLKLKIEAIYNDYVQPTCIWSSEMHKRLPGDQVIGTIVGWGIDSSDEPVPELKQATMPKISDIKCIRKNPVYYANALRDEKKFCAGWANGTSACNGDSGGGFFVFVPDTDKAESSNVTGSWFIRGIVSTTIVLKNYAKCDSNQYVVFTDVEKYTNWIQRYLDN